MKYLYELEIEGLVIAVNLSGKDLRALPFERTSIDWVPRPSIYLAAKWVESNLFSLPKWIESAKFTLDGWIESHLGLRWIHIGTTSLSRASERSSVFKINETDYTVVTGESFESVSFLPSDLPRAKFTHYRSKKKKLLERNIYLAFYLTCIDWSREAPNRSMKTSCILNQGSKLPRSSRF